MDDTQVYCKTNDGHIIKTLFELLQNNIKSGIYHFDANGITMRQTDSQQKILIDLALKREYFNLYSVKTPFTNGLNHTIIYRMLRSIKKKDSISFFIRSDQPSELGIEIVPKEKNRTTTSYVKVQNVQLYDIQLPTGYDSCVIIPSIEYQKMIKDMGNMSNKIKIVNMGSQLKFVCTNDCIYSREVLFGEKTSHPVSEQFEQEFETESLSRISKISGLNSFLQIYQSKNLPLLIKSGVGMLGTISIYIKDNEQIEQEIATEND
jgi:proliferating cell nuclear antigen